MVRPAVLARPHRRLRGAASGSCPEWAPLPVQYADYTLWQRELLGDPDDPESLHARQLGYWRQALAGIPEELALPTDRPRPAAPSHDGGLVEARLPCPTYQRLTALTRETGASMFMVLHAGVATLLHRLGAGDDIPLGIPVAGRTHEALDDLVGFLVNTLVLRTDLSGEPSFTELLARVREATLAALDHQDLPFERVVDALNPARARSRNPLFQVMVSYQDRRADEPDVLGLGADVRLADNGAAMFDLSFVLTESHHGDLTVEIEYAADLFDRPTVETLAQRLEAVLVQVTEDPQRPVSSVDLVLPAERHKMLEVWNATDHPVPELTVTALFEAQARRTPHATALIVDPGPPLTAPRP